MHYEEYEEAGEFVWISHGQFLPCDAGEHHLVSNWPIDVAKVLGK